MSEADQNQQKEFVFEKIKERPMNKRKLAKRTFTTAALAVVFGLIACFTFLFLEPIMSKWLYPEEEPAPVLFPEDKEEMSPEEMLTDIMQENQEKEKEKEQEKENIPETVVLEQSQIEEILNQVVMDRENYEEMYSVMSSYVKELNRSMVTITGISSVVDWMNNVAESRNQSSGVLVAENGREYFILADYEPLKGAQVLKITFSDASKADAQVRQIDPFTGLAVITVGLSELSEEQKKEIQIAQLGSSYIRNITGTPVVAIGSPQGVSGSVEYGMITALARQLSVVDANYKLLSTNLYGSQKAGGVLFNLQNEVIGVITSRYSSTDMKNMISAIGISELKKLIEKLSNEDITERAYLGITGMDVSEEANEELGIPYGAFVRETEMDSPAMLAGIQQGDIIVKMNDKLVTNMNEYTMVLMQLKAGQNIEVVLMRQVQEEYREMVLNITTGVVEP